MKSVVAVFLVIAVTLSAVPPASAQPQQLMQGTEVHLTLLTPISSSTSRAGDPFVAVLAQPIVFNNQTVVPAGTRIRGVIGNIQKAKAFNVFRGQAYLSLAFKSMEIDSRLIPVQMSLVAIGQPRIDSYSRPRHDIKITEGEVLQEKHDFKGDAMGLAVGGGGGTLFGLLLGNITRGMGIGFIGGAAYVVARKGKEVDLPAQSGLLARLDSTITVPYVSANLDNLTAQPASR